MEWLFFLGVFLNLTVPGIADPINCEKICHRYKNDVYTLQAENSYLQSENYQLKLAKNETEKSNQILSREVAELKLGMQDLKNDLKLAKLEFKLAIAELKNQFFERMDKEQDKNEQDFEELENEVENIGKQVELTGSMVQTLNDTKLSAPIQIQKIPIKTCLGKGEHQIRKINQVAADFYLHSSYRISFNLFLNSVNPTAHAVIFRIGD